MALSKDIKLTYRSAILKGRRGQPATVPGTLVPHAEAMAPKVSLVAYGPQRVESQALKNEDDIVNMSHVQPVNWLNIEGVGHTQPFHQIKEVFGLHPLALEDCLNLNQRPKTEEYKDHLYMVLSLPVVSSRLSFEQISLFLGERYLISIQEQSSEVFNPIKERLQKEGSRIRTSGPDYLAYALIDAVVEQINDRLETLEGNILDFVKADVIEEVHTIRHDLHAMRRMLIPLREAIRQLMRTETGLVHKQTRTFLRDCLDHTEQLLDAVEACRELSIGLMDLYLSETSYRTNEIMKVLTLIATIFIPLSFIAGVYGMNFSPQTSPWNMPELQWYLGYPFVLLLMLVTALGFVWFFFRRGWLGKPRRAKRRK